MRRQRRWSAGEADVDIRLWELDPAFALELGIDARAALKERQRQQQERDYMAKMDSWLQ